MTTKAQSTQGPGTGEMTRGFEAMREGDPKAEEELLSHVYHDFGALAASNATIRLPSP